MKKERKCEDTRPSALYILLVSELVHYILGTLPKALYPGHSSNSPRARAVDLVHYTLGTLPSTP